VRVKKFAVDANFLTTGRSRVKKTAIVAGFLTRTVADAGCGRFPRTNCAAAPVRAERRRAARPSGRAACARACRRAIVGIAISMLHTLAPDLRLALTALVDGALARRAVRWPLAAVSYLLCSLAGLELSLAGADPGTVSLLGAGLGGCLLLERGRRRRHGAGARALPPA
jgi:hypothetical protein